VSYPQTHTMPSFQEIVDDLGRSEILLSVAVAGGGASGITDLMTCSGCSKFLFDFQVPYGKGAFDSIAGHLMDLDYKYVTQEAADRLAKGMLTQQLRKCHDTDGKIRASVGVTSKLTTGPGEREGRNHVVYFSAILHDVDSVEISTGLEYIPLSTTRLDQENEVAGALLAFLTALAVEARHLRDMSSIFNPFA